MTLKASRVSRRNLLRGMGGLGLTALLGGSLAACSESRGPSAKDLLASTDRYFIAHRGSADEAPEHTLAAYTQAVQRGARAVEVSVQRTRDGVLVCHHDPTLERTCRGLRRTIGEMDFAELANVRVDMTRHVGPGWGTQPIPRLDEVLDQIGGHTVLFVEPKDVAARADLIRAITSRGLQESTVFKQHHVVHGDDAAREAGLAVWNYLDLAAGKEQIAALAERSDAIGADANNDPLDPERIAQIEAAAATGKPVIAWAVDRRHQVEQLVAMGVRGFMASAWSYLALQPTSERQDGFDTGRVRPGDLPSHQPAEPVLAWNTDGSIALTDTTGTQSLTMGSMCPLPSGGYVLALEMRFDTMPPEKSQHAGVVIGRDDDAPYRFGIAGPSGGQLVILRANGSLELRQIPPDNGSSVVLAVATGEPVVAGRWETLEIRLNGTTVEVSRTPTDGRPTVVRGSAPSTGRYFALTRNYAGEGAAVRFRNVLVSDLSV